VDLGDRVGSSFGSGILSLFGRGSSPNVKKEEKKNKLFFGEKLNIYTEFNNGALGYPFNVEGKTYPSSEHFFQSQKYKGSPALMEEIRQLKSAYEAFTSARSKRFSSQIRRDWGEVREAIMQQAVREKFKQNPALMRLLMSTGEAELIRSDMGDAFWGDGGDGRGLNKLGKIIMSIRDEQN